MNKEREEYLAEVAENYGVPISIVHDMANILGPNEDKDGLISALEEVSNEIAE